MAYKNSNNNYNNARGSRSGAERRPNGDRYNNNNKYGKERNSDRYNSSDRYNKGDKFAKDNDDRYNKGSRYSKDGGRERRQGDDRYNKNDHYNSKDRYNKDDRYSRNDKFSGDTRRNFDKKTDDFKRRDFEKAVERENDKDDDYEQDELPYILMGRNAVKEAIKSGRSIDRILVKKELDGSLREIISLARDRNLIIREVDNAKLNEICMPFGHGTKTGNHQGIVAQVPGVEYCEISDILDVAKERNEKPFIILLDGIEDPHNLGSIIRSAECAGAHGVIIPKRRAVSVTSTVAKSSAGAIEHIKIAKVANLVGAIERLKDEGLWIAGADMSGNEMTKADLKGATALVIGSEGSGVSKLVKERCDFLVSIPLFGKVDSLNASVAAGILMFEKKRQDMSQKA